MPDGDWLVAFRSQADPFASGASARARHLRGHYASRSQALGYVGYHPERSCGPGRMEGVDGW
jgi:hypothetical protein